MMRSLGHSRRLLCRSIPRGASPIAPAFLSLAVRHRRGFHGSSPFWGIRSQVLKDVGEGEFITRAISVRQWLTSVVEGITEVQIIQWYVEEGAHVEEWKPLCQYQSDKAVDDVRSVFTCH